MSDHAATIIVLAKEPVPGRVKTRLQPVFSAGQAARLAAAALGDTVAAVRRCWGDPPHSRVGRGSSVLAGRLRGDRSAAGNIQ